MTSKPGDVGIFAEARASANRLCAASLPSSLSPNWIHEPSPHRAPAGNCPTQSLAVRGSKDDSQAGICAIPRLLTRSLVARLRSLLLRPYETADVRHLVLFRRRALRGGGRYSDGHRVRALRQVLSVVAFKAAVLQAALVHRTLARANNDTVTM